MAITYNTIEEALQDLRNGKCILVTDIRIGKTRATSSVPDSLPQRKTSTSWQVPQKG